MNNSSIILRTIRTIVLQVSAKFVLEYVLGTKLRIKTHFDAPRRSWSDEDEPEFELALELESVYEPVSSESLTLESESPPQNLLACFKFYAHGKSTS